MLSYGSVRSGFLKDFLYKALLLACCVSLVTVPLFGYLSDLFGRRLVYIVGAVTLSIFVLPVLYDAQ